MQKKAFINNATRLAAVLGLAAVFFCLGVRAQQISFPQLVHGHVPPAISRLHLRPLYNLPKTNRINLAISLPLRNEATLDELIRQIYKPGSTNYHHYLTPKQFAEQFGPTEQDYQAIIKFAQANGLRVTATYSNRILIDVSGNVDAVQNVLHTTLQVFNHPTDNRTFFAPDAEPRINLGVPILHISGLDNFHVPIPALKIKKFASNRPSGTRSAQGSGPGEAYMGKDFRAAYAPGVTLNGGGQKVGLLELEGYYPSDITTYETAAGLPHIAPTTVLIDDFPGPQPGDTNGLIEVSLDIEMAISMATNLTEVMVYEATNNGSDTPIVDILARMVSDDQAKQISSSWLIEDDPSFDTYYKEMAAQGQSFFQASGDFGAYYSDVPQWADDTNITLVGGTTLTTSSPGGPWSSESAWNWLITDPANGEGGTGGGVNFNGVRIPSWQQGISMALNQGSTILRNVPDVALAGDNIFVEATNTQFTVGGTSCAAPLWAGFTALMNQQAATFSRPSVGFLNPAIYAIGKSPAYTNDFHDITTGNNTNAVVGNEWSAVPGYDLCTGWGTPNGQNLINALVPPDSLVITPSIGFSASGLSGGPFTPASQVYTLTNFSASSLTWSLINTSSWLNASATGGSLAAGATTSVTISLTAAADSMAVGTYNTMLIFSNGVSHVAQSPQFTLQVIEPLTVAPVAGLSASGPAGGSFLPTSQNFLLTNIGPNSLNWQVAGPSWLTFSPSSGTIAGGKSATVGASINANVNALVAGVYNGQVAFTDETSGQTVDGAFTLSVGQTIVQNGGFETGDFTDWTLTEPNGDAGETFVDEGATGIPPHSGDFFAALGDANGLGSLSQTVTTVVNQPYLLSLWLYSPNVSEASGGQDTASTPNQFEVVWNGTTLYDQADLSQFNFWSNMVFVVTATKSSTVLKFEEEDVNYWLGLDDVNVWPIPLPNVQSVSHVSKTKFSFTWNSLPGLAYEVQYSTNLLSTNWFNLSTNTATSTTMTVTNSVRTNQYLFYRIVRLP